MSRSCPALRRVLMTADAIGGVWTYALELARALSRQGVRVTLAVMGPAPSSAQQGEVRDISGLELYHAPFRLEWMDDPWVDLARAGEWLLRLEGRVKPDIVHLNGYVHAALPWRAPVLVVGHSCVLSWWEAVHLEPPPNVWDRYRREVGNGLRSAHAVVAPTAALLRQLERHYGPLPPATVIPNGRDARAFPPRDSRRPLIFTAGRLWDEAKNIAVLERVAPTVPWPIFAAGVRGQWDSGSDTSATGRETLIRVDESLDWFVASPVDPAEKQAGAGESPHRSGELRSGDLPAGEPRSAESRTNADPGEADGQCGKINYCGSLTNAQLAHWLGQASIFALPARYEPFGLTALEAALAGCALVLGDIPSLREVWGDAALYVPPDDAEVLGAALNDLITDPIRCIALGVRAMVRALHYTPERTAARYLGVYQHLLADPRGALHEGLPDTAPLETPGATAGARTAAPAISPLASPAASPAGSPAGCGLDDSKPGGPRPPRSRATSGRRGGAACAS